MVYSSLNMTQKVESPSEVGLVFAGGTIFATVNAEGFRNAEVSTDLVDFVNQEFPDLRVRISQPGAVGYTGLSENIDLSTLERIKQSVIELLRRSSVRSVAMTHGSDFPEVTGSHLDQDEEIKKLLRQKRGSICITYSNNPYPADEARMNLSATIEAADTDREPGVYITTEHGVVPIAGARKETYSGRPMRFFDYNDPAQKAEEDGRRFKVFKTANELAQQLGYSGIFAIMATGLMKSDNPSRKGQWVATTPAPYKSTYLERSTEGLSERDVLLTASISHAFDREQITPFPGYEAFFWPVNRPTDPFSVEGLIQGFFPETRACILILNHSSTAHTKTPDLSIATAVQRMRIERNIVTFAVTENGEPTRFGEGSYVTSRDLRNAGVIPLPMHSKVAYAKMYTALDKGLRGLDMFDFMTTQVHVDEFTGELDQESIQYARDLARVTPIRELRRPGYGTGYLLITERQYVNSFRQDSRRI